ncbi:MAG TPA: ACT domain-containing protein [Candidatus Pygmaiobacter gallistercoris]|nr:ACT domain-containing protein [Candidatus Pygmaiobacter gallistercoris]
MKAVITVVGKDTVGILAKVAGVCAEANVNVEEVTQSILAGTFAMIMVVDISNCAVPFDQLQQQLAKAGEEKGVDVKTTRQELYDAMHHI